MGKAGLSILGLLFLDWQIANYFNTDVITVLLFSLYVVIILIKNPRFFIRYLMVFFMSVGNIVGVYICENESIYLTELGIMSHFVGSFSLLVIGWTLFIHILYLWDSKYDISNDGSDNILIHVKFQQHNVEISNMFMWTIVLLEIALLIRVFPVPFWITGTDRFFIHKVYITGIWEKGFYFILLSIPIIVSNILNKKSKLAYGILSTYIGILFWTGEKFGAYWNIIVLFCIMISVKYNYKNQVYFRMILKKFVMVGSCLFLVIFVNFFLLYGKNENNHFSDYFLQRVAQQGQLWWRTYELIKQSNDSKMDELQDEFRTYFSSDESYKKDYNHAIYKIMRFTTPKAIFDKRIASGSRYSTSTFATMYYYFKEYGVLIYPIFGASLFFWISYIFMYSVARSYLIETLLSFKILVASYPALAMSEFNFLFSYKVTFYFIFVIGLLIFRNQWGKRRENESAK